MRNQIQMFAYLSENIDSHNFKSEGNKIIAKRLFNSRSFASFKITFLKNGMVSFNAGGRSIRFTSESDLYDILGSVSSTKNYRSLTLV